MRRAGPENKEKKGEPLMVRRVKGYETHAQALDRAKFPVQKNRPNGGVSGTGQAVGKHFGADGRDENNSLQCDGCRCLLSHTGGWRA